MGISHAPPWKSAGGYYFRSFRLTGRAESASAHQETDNSLFQHPSSLSSYSARAMATIKHHQLEIGARDAAEHHVLLVGQKTPDISCLYSMT